MNTSKLNNYKRILSEIAKERGLDKLSEYILSYEEKEEISKINTTMVIDSGLPPENRNTPEPYIAHTKTKYNITKLPEATCDGCQ